MSSSTQVSKHYTGEQGAEYRRIRQSVTDHPGFELNFKRFRPYLKPDDRVLDFGCGNGGMLRVMVREIPRVEGLEVNPAAAEIAQSSGVRIYRSIAELPKVPTYNAVVTNHVLEHVRDVCATLEELRQSILPGGLLIASLPIDDWRKRHQRGWSRNDVDHHLQTWTPRLFANVLYESGYDAVDCHVIHWAWHPRLFPFMKFGLGMPAFYLASILTKTRGLLGVGRVPQP